MDEAKARAVAGWLIDGARSALLEWTAPNGIDVPE
jgi:hypothetical protein